MHPIALLGWPERHHRHRKSTGRPIPRTGEELKADFGAFLEGLLVDVGSSEPVDKLVSELVQRGLFASFHPEQFLPKSLTANQSWDYLGCDYDQWCDFLKAGKKFLPKPISGKPKSPRAVWRTADILTFPNLRDFGRPSLWPEVTIRAFEDCVRAQSERVFKDWTKMDQKTDKKTTRRVKPDEVVFSFVGWPIGVPKDNAALYRDYRWVVERTLNRYFRPSASQSIDDLKQHIWTQLIAAKTIEKFVEKARLRKIPARLTAQEAIDYLRISWDQWLDLMRKDLSWLRPVEGTAFSTTAVFTGYQIRNVEESGRFPIVDAIPASDMTKVFKGYLQNAVHNHFANYCRTRTRRFNKDVVLPENVRISGGHVHVALEGDLTTWEDALMDPSTLDPDFSPDIPQGMTCVEDVQEEIEKIRVRCPGRQQDVFDLVAEGYTIQEAIQEISADIHWEKVRARSAG